MNKKRKKIFLIHFLPLELYPPIMNLIDYFSKMPEWQVVVVTNKEGNNWLSYTYSNEAANIRIYRPGTQSKFSRKRFFNYFLFYISSFFLLLRHHPDVVFYFETISSWPALIYKRIRKNGVMLMVHYHEYTTTAEYQSRMILTKWMHKMELKMYGRISWISQTNEIRLQKFKDDNLLNNLTPSVFHILPNYPPKKWSADAAKSFHTNPTRLVYVGSLGYKNMYLQEVIDWITQHETLFTLDIYAFNMDEKAKLLLKNNQFRNIHFHGGCDYRLLPQILKNFDIGLVIYKPFSQNTIHAVSNKVFEYLACGLDVWFSKDMSYTFNYINENSYPKVIPVDFTALSRFDYKAAMSRSNMEYVQHNYYYEDIYADIAAHINHSVKENAW